MTTEELQELQEKAALWDSLGKTLMDMYGTPIKAVKMECELTKEGYLRVPETLQNTSNASSHIDVLKEEFGEHLCSCNLKKCECLILQDTVEKM